MFILQRRDLHIVSDLEDMRDGVVTINGLRFAEEALRALTLLPPGTWLRLEGRSPGGALTVRQASPEQCVAIDELIGLKEKQ